MYDEFLKTIKQLGAYDINGDYWLDFKIEDDVICITYNLQTKETFDFFTTNRNTKRCIIDEKVSTIKGFVEFLMRIISITSHGKGMSDALEEIRINYNK